MMVVKIGGTEGVDFEAICNDIKTNLNENTHMILVHGGSSEATKLGTQLGHPPRFVTSPSGYTSRYTDLQTMEIFNMAVNGKVNSILVQNLQKLEINAIGLSGVDGRLMVARRKSAIRIIEDGKRKILRDDYTGKIEEINTSLLFTLLEQGYIPVVSPIAISMDGEALNVDGDRAAAMIAHHLQAQTVIFLTGAPGLLKAFPDESTLISSISFSNIESYQSYAQGRMRKKVLGVTEALENGVRTAIISDGRIDSPISKALNGAGTRFTT
ncbi:MAG: [LysW]-aminoadipate kinase [Anaerolineaceae bacterium]|nr:[LysW]-aminoadipate kinase [Anaerolineaceae bacterium]